ncbi:MAG: Bug family tripartite tricarboxylate transporter substrate binding protein [Xanthobacteraceae bacterium]
MLVRRFQILLPLALIGAITASTAHAQDFYKGKTLTVLVGFTPGGGFDRNARTMALHLGKHIPGKPTVVVQNMPGAGSLTSVRAIDATMAKDGTVINVFNPGYITRSIVDPRVKVDFRKFAWVGVIAADTRICYGYGPKSVKTFADLMKRQQFIMGSTAKGAGNYINGATLRVVFKAPVKQIVGFPGSAEQRIAIERGELDGDCGSFHSIPRNWVRDKKIHPFVRFTEQRRPEIPESAVFINTFAKSEEQKQLLDMLNAADDVGRPVIMSGQVPKDRVAILRKAFNETMKDPAFLADMKKQQLPSTPLTGEEAEKVVAKMTQAPPKIVAEARKVFE